MRLARGRLKALRSRPLPPAPYACALRSGGGRSAGRILSSMSVDSMAAAVEPGIQAPAAAWLLSVRQVLGASGRVSLAM